MSMSDADRVHRAVTRFWEVRYRCIIVGAVDSLAGIVHVDSQISQSSRERAEL
jgi:hypothetical protein